jgi:hypothetical protein
MVKPVTPRAVQFTRCFVIEPLEGWVIIIQKLYACERIEKVGGFMKQSGLRFRRI